MHCTVLEMAISQIFELVYIISVFILLLPNFYSMYLGISSYVLTLLMVMLIFIIKILN